MTDEQQIKIRIQASAEDFKTVMDAVNAKLAEVGKSAEFVAGKVRGTEKAMNSATSSIKEVSNALSSADNQVKKSAQTWTHLALVVQDLPFGFRGIQNNLPAVFGDLAAATGPLYFAFSSIVAGMTAYSMGLFNISKKTEEADKYSKEFAETITNESVKLSSLYRVSTDTTRSMSDRLAAAVELKKEYPGLLDKYTAEDIALGKAKDSYTQLTEIISRYAKAKAAEKTIIDINTQILDNEYKINKALKDIGPFEGRRYVGNEQTSAFLLWQGKVYNSTKDLKSANVDLTKQLEYYQQILDANVTSMKELDDAKGKGAKSSKKLEDNTIETLKAQQAFYRDNILMYTAYEQEILRREEDLAIKQAQVEGKSQSYLNEIRKRYNQLRINSAKEAGDKITEIEEKLGKEQGQESLKALKAQEEAARQRKIIDDRELQNSLDSLKIESDVRTKILDKTNKNDSAGRIQILEDYKNKLYDLASIGGFTADQFDKIDDAIKRVNAAIEGSKPQLKTFQSDWTDTTNQIFSVINKFVEDAAVQLGENLGKAIAGKKTDILGGFPELLGGALEDVGKALIAWGVALEAIKLAQINPALAIAAGIGLVAAGAALKASNSKAQSTVGGGSANYGNVNSNAIPGRASIPQNGYGMVGNYPKAGYASVPSAFDSASQNGTFVLKGQDLLLSVNRAQKASQLKGQNINLGG